MDKKDCVDSGVLGTGVGAGDETGEMLKDGSVEGKLENGGRLPLGSDGIIDKSDKSGKDDFGKEGMVGCATVVVWRRLRASTLMLDIVATKNKVRMKDLEEAIDYNWKNYIERR